ncbi:MAG: endonuclease domain-containing protein [Snowella sp.]|nr:endonuclease domain-containing protein [Snowella sp.]
MTTFKEGQYFLPYNPQLIERAKEMRKQPTLAERKLWGYLRTFPVKIWRQKPINHFIVDFYCPKLKLVIEVDGDSHSTDSALIYDQERTRILESYGLKIIRFTNVEVLNNFKGVCEEIRSFIPP